MHAAVQRAGGYDGLPDADGQTSDGLRVKGLGQEVQIYSFLLMGNHTISESQQSR